MSQSLTKPPVITGNEIAGYVVYRGKQSYNFTISPVGQLYDYVFAGNGIFLHALRTGLNVCLHVSDASIRGLATLEEWTTFSLPVLPAAYLKKMLEMSIAACVDQGQPTEALFHLHWNIYDGRWQLDKPAQKATATTVKPVDDGPNSSYARALIELHSHHQMEAFFSDQDDADEQGFRIYAVIGEIFTEPKLRVRVGCFGHFLEIPATTVFELPSSIGDALEEKNELVETR